MIIDISSPIGIFDKEFNDIENRNIIFSAPYGSGKTFFLKEYFKSKSELFNSFRISPVNYVVGNNEDIFEYIKADIAKLIIQKVIDSQQVEIPFELRADLKVYQYLINKPKDIFRTILKLVQVFSDPVSSGVAKSGEDILDNVDSYQKFQDGIKESLKTNHQKLAEYLDGLINIKGSIFEDDIITQAIGASLRKTSTSNEKNVLIIDDLDRLDPEHIFRILNILSAHQDDFDELESITVNMGLDNNSRTKNKFGFDKIIIVCDVDNIRSVYKHRYGDDSSFDGYIAKFHSNDIFRFSNQNAITFYCTNGLGEYVQNVECEALISLILIYCVENKILTLRSILKHRKVTTIQEFEMDSFIFKYPDEYNGTHLNESDYLYSFKSETVNAFRISSSDFPLLKVFKILTIIFGDYQKLTQFLSKEETVGHYNKSFANSVLKSIAPLSHFTKYHDQPAYLAFGYDLFGKNGGLVLWPKANVLNQRLTLDLGWSSSNQYTYAASYYTNLSNNLLNKTLPTDSFDNSYKKLFKEIAKILQFLQDKNFLQKLNITQ